MKKFALVLTLGLAFSGAAERASAAPAASVPVSCLESVQCLKTVILYGPNPGPFPAPVNAQPAANEDFAASFMTMIESPFTSLFARFFSK